MRKIPTFTWAVVGLVLIGVIWVLVSREKIPRPPAPGKLPPAPAQLPPELAEAAGSGLKILHFYGHTAEPVKGERLTICYGVRDARSVRLEPPVETITPSLNRCFTAQPEVDTTYRLTAQGADGAEVSASFTVHVKPAPPNILFVTINQKELRRGQPLMLCYGVEHAVKVALEPLEMALPPSERRCIRLYPVRTTAYTLVAAGEDGRTDRERFTVTVK